MQYQYSLPTETNYTIQMLPNLSIAQSTMVLEITSTAFKQGEFIPEKYTCDGQNATPDIIVKSLPLETKSLAVIVDDPDAPVGTWVHWIAWNILPNSVIKSDKLKGRQGINDFGMRRYCGPCPPRGVHHYHFKVYALDSFLMNLSAHCTKYQLEKAMASNIIAFGELIGLYKRH